MTVAMIAALSENNVIGRDNALPWHLPADLKRFKRLTTGHPIIMGRKTWESIGRPLPGRRSIVISRTAGFHPDGATVVPSIEAALAALPEAGLVFVIGGQRVFEAALPLTDRLELTRVHAALPGDAFFPPIDFSEWNLTAEAHHPADQHHAFAFSFLTYDRARARHPS
jgi:dihydrofolate reductase